MADNYLERKMEEYRSGGNTRSMVRVVKNPTGTLLVEFPFSSVLVFAENSDDRTALLLSRLKSTGCKLGLAGTDADAMRRLAKARGAMYVPYADANAAIRTFSSIISGPDAIFFVRHTQISAFVYNCEYELGQDVEKALLQLLIKIPLSHSDKRD